MLPALKQNLGGHKFKGDSELDTIMTRWPIAKDMDGKSDGIAALLNVNCSY
jgi:hypothetical protein